MSLIYQREFLGESCLNHFQHFFLCEFSAEWVLGKKIMR